MKINHSYTVIAKEYLDKHYSNRYFSVRIYSKDQLIACLPYQYGYGNTYIDEFHQFLIDRYEDVTHENVYAITRSINIIFEKIEGCKKSDVVKWGNK